jgi:hypothetical protein
LRGISVHFEDGDVASLWQRDENRIARTIGVILAKLVAQPAGIDPHDGIGAVEVQVSAVEFVREHRLLERVPAALKRLLDDKPQEQAETLGTREAFAGQQVLELGTNL